MVGKQSFAQFSLGTLLLITACAGTWFFVWQQSKHLEDYESKVLPLRALDRELTVYNGDRIAVVGRLPLKYDESIWDLYLPLPASLQLATREVSQQELANPPPISAECSLSAGRHKVELRTLHEGEQWVTLVLVDDQESIRCLEPAQWNSGRGSSGGGLHTQQTTLDSQSRLLLFKRTFTPLVIENHSDFPPLPANGQELWIMPN